MSKADIIKPNDKYIPWLVVLFFLVFMAVDAIMVTIAIRTQTGIITEDAYEKGLAYNQTIAASREQDSWGWSHNISLENDKLTFTLQDKSMAPISEADVSARIIRDVQDGYDFEVILKKSARNIFETDIDFPLAGEWTIRIFASSQDRTYQASKKVIIK